MEIKKMNKRVVFGDEARSEMLKGVEILAKAVKSTLGAKGRNVLIQKQYGIHSTKDGVSVASEIMLDDQVQNSAIKAVLEASERSNKIAGDGTTTSVVLTEAIFKEGCKMVGSGICPMAIQKGINKATEKAVEEIRKLSTEVKSKKEIAQVATISANNNSEIGNKIAEILETVGHDSPITIEHSNSTGFEIEITEGMDFESGYLSPYFVTNTDKMTAELKNPYILLVEDKIINPQSIIKLLGEVAKTNRPLLVIADNVENKALSTLVINKVRGGLDVCAVRAKGYGKNKKDFLQDLSVLVNGKVISNSTGIKLEDTTLEQLGQCKKVIVSQKDTIIVDGFGSNEDIEAHCDFLRSQLQEASDYKKSELQNRIAKLAGKIGVLRVGGSTEFEAKNKLDLVEDALCAAKAAISDGILGGGGLALLQVSKKLDNLKYNSEGEKAGIGIVKKALKAPCIQICDNGGLSGIIIANKLLENKDTSIGFNVLKEEYVNMIEEGIIDPTLVVITALKGASSVASLLLTTEVCIVDKEI